MFGGFEKRTDHGASRRYGVATLVAAAILIAAASVAVALSDPEAKEQEKEDGEVIWIDQEKPDVPPPPVIVKPPPVAKATTSNRPPPPATVAPPPPPKKIERDPLPLGDAEKFNATTSGDDGGEVADLTAGMDLGGGGQATRPAETVVKPPPPPPKPKAKTGGGGGPIMMPENAVAPKRLDDAIPEYPGDAQAAGLEGDVYLKIVINEDGSVGDIEVKKGEEPFVSAAIASVKRWKYSPALVDGKATAIYRVIKVPFRLAN